MIAHALSGGFFFALDPSVFRLYLSLRSIFLRSLFHSPPLSTFLYLLDYFSLPLTRPHLDPARIPLFLAGSFHRQIPKLISRPRREETIREPVSYIKSRKPGNSCKIVCFGRPKSSLEDLESFASYWNVADRLEVYIISQ